MPGTSPAPASRRDRGPMRGHLLPAILPVLLCALLSYFEPFGVRALRDLVFDSYQRLAPRPYAADGPVRVVAIDDESLHKLGRWPWPRARIAELIDKLTQSGTAAIAVDVLLSEPESDGAAEGASPGDRRLAEAIGASNVVLGIALTDYGTAPVRKAGFANSGADPRPWLRSFPASLQPLPVLRDAAQGLGAMNVTPDRDLVVREIPTLFNVGGEIVPSLDVEALRIAQRASTIVVFASDSNRDNTLSQVTGLTRIRFGQLEYPTSGDGSIRIRFAGTQDARRVPAWKVLAGEVDPQWLEGSVVLIGGTAAALGDIRATPLEPVVPGVDIRAEFLESILSGQLLTRPDYMRGLEVILVLIGGIFAFSAATRMAPFPAAIVTSVLVAGFLLASGVAFLSLQQLLDPLWPAVATFGCFGVTSVSVLRRSEHERQQVREAFSRYLSPAIVETLARDPSRLVLGGETRTLTVLFSDVRGFTARSETLAAEEVVRFLNEIHTPMTEHVLDTGGTLDKFIGDGMMAFWNAPLDHPDHIRSALRCALHMRETIVAIDERMQEESRDLGLPVVPVQIGIGIHTGPACVGNVGSLRRFDYSAIGDTVNTAARMEPLCKPLCVSMVVSAEIVDGAPDFAFLSLGHVTLRGRQGATRIYTVHGDETAVTDDFRRFRDQHDAAVAMFERRDPAAFAAIEACTRHPLAARYLGFYDTMLVKRPAPPALASAS